MVHLVKAHPEMDAYGRIKARCGRYVRQRSATTALTETECKQCREAFAKILRDLPGYDGGH